jgi:hypothetical protein
VGEAVNCAVPLRGVELPLAEVPERQRQMTDLMTRMVRESVEVFFNLDAGQARWICRLDDKVGRYERPIP